LQDDREQLAQLAFEVFNVSGLFLADQALLSLYSVGKSTGLVVDFGHTKTGKRQRHISPLVTFLSVCFANYITSAGTSTMAGACFPSCLFSLSLLQAEALTSRRLLPTADVSMVVDGLLYLPSVRRLPFGGRDVTQHLQQLLAARGVIIDDLDIVQARDSCHWPSRMSFSNAGQCLWWSPQPAGECSEFCIWTAGPERRLR
jgi:Actin